MGSRVELARGMARAGYTVTLVSHAPWREKDNGTQGRTLLSVGKRARDDDDDHRQALAPCAGQVPAKSRCAVTGPPNAEATNSHAHTIRRRAE